MISGGIIIMMALVDKMGAGFGGVNKIDKDG